jgi:hypothetical protein
MCASFLSLFCLLDSALHRLVYSCHELCKGDESLFAASKFDLLVFLQMLPLMGVEINAMLQAIR